MVRGTNVTDMKRTYRTAVLADYPAELTLRFKKDAELRYGENPNQPAALYNYLQPAPITDGNHSITSIADLTNLRQYKSGKGGLSATNVMDAARALDILKFFSRPSVAVMKHLVPSGFATQNTDEDLSAIYERARDADKRSAFGSVVAFNVPVDKATAEALMSTYVEVVAAPGFEQGTADIFEKKKDLRLISYQNLQMIPKFDRDVTAGLYDLKMLPTGRAIIQKPYLSSIKGLLDLIFDPYVEHEGVKYLVEREPTEQEARDLLTAWYVNIGVRSNGIVIVKDGTTVAIGTGQQERVGAVEQAIIKAYQKAMDRENISYDPLSGAAERRKISHNPLDGAVISSDAFFPFRDSIDLVASVGITAIIQPGGSVRDQEVIQAVNQHQMAMAYTLERCFGHF